MANINAARGFIPVRYYNGHPYTGAVNTYYVPATDTTTIFVGDPVVLTGTGDANGVPAVTLGTSGGGTYTTGVMVGIVPTTRDTPTYRLPSTGVYILVADDPEILFEIQEDDSGGALPVTAIGNNADYAINTGSTITGRSAAQLKASTQATTATLQLRIRGFVPRADNAVGTAAKVLVTFNLHTSKNLTGI